jgi:DNA-binding MarR family transcriptional regulator
MLKHSGIDISSDQWSVLMALSENDGPSQTDLAIKLYKVRSNITRILDIMEKMDLIERRRSPSDKREYNVFITVKGKSMIPDLKKAAASVLDKALQNANKEELAIVKTVLNKIFMNLEQ